MTGHDLNPPLSLDDARKLIFSHLTPLATETISLFDTPGRVLRQNLIAPYTSPPQNLSTMDGYAISGLSLSSWQVVGACPAGSLPPTLSSGEALRVFTGSQLPPSIDAVIPQEHTYLSHHTLTSSTHPLPQDFILPAGSDFQKNTTVLSSPRRLTARDTALCASLGYQNLTVSKKPHITLISTGSELTLPGKPLAQGQIYASNAFALAPLIHHLGGIPSSPPPLIDDKKLIAHALSHALDNSSLLVTIGGASVGDYDLVKPALRELGCNILFERVNTRPGRPIFFALSPHNVPVLGLPGNPASCMVGSWLYLADIIPTLCGLPPPPTLPFQYAPSLSPFPKAPPIDVFYRAVFSAHTESDKLCGRIVSPLSQQESGLTLPTARADALIFRKAHSPPLTTLENVPILTPPHSFL